jgi:predicted dehydrogenase
MSLAVNRSQVRLGLVGAGRWGRNIIQTIAGMDAARLVRVASANPETASLVGTACLVEPDWRKVVGAPDIDGVIVATPPETHAEICLAAIARRLPVFVEKPLALDPGEAALVAAACERNGTPVLVDHIHLFHESYDRLKAETVRHGGIVSLATRGGNRGPFRAFPPLQDWGAHDLALMLDLCGTDATLADARRTKAATCEGFAGEVYEVRLEWQGGRSGTAVFGNLFEKKERRLEAVCRDAALVMDDTAGDPLVAIEDGRTRALDVARSQPLRRALDAFVRAVRGEAEPKIGARLGLRVVELLAEIERVAR